MAMGSVLSRGALTRSMQTTRGATRYFSDGKGRVRSEEERAAGNVPFEKKLGENMQKLKEEAEEQLAQKEKDNNEKEPEGTH